ncbi:TRAP transporter TatT component family protein [Tahibacter amnicola]|uniref:TRAP transporter TatT component family protein n=1 Tax=Tahibacter amnicola TaxID=2976241 RepID=A0ABY6BFF2_9GAMM|nr:TRAP transporter TatT component family protein [Tahibacter amnicola]UXI66597.1 TRAP transporter TatT component family protein [Tahibacter amnicola]
MKTSLPRKFAGLCLAAVALSGCAGIVNKATQRFADNLGTAILNENDPATVRDGVPAYLLLLDALIQGDPNNTGTLLAGAKLYGAYAGGFVTEPERGKRLSLKAFDYARRATCIRSKPLCDVLAQPYETFAAAVNRAGAKEIDILYGLGSAWAGRIQQDSGDWNAIADLPKVQLIFERILALSPDYEAGAPNMVMGVLHSLRPESLGGKPELGKTYFEKAIAMSGGKNLMAKTLYAQYYARLVFDQELHDRLLNEVIAAPAEAPTLTLMNTLAQERGKLLLQTGKDYF